MNNVKPAKLRRIFVMDFIRILCALLIFMRHSITMFGISYGKTINSIALDFTSIVMTCFFMISGFSIYFSTSHRNLGNIKEKLQFYLKRAIAILPAYYLVHFLWILFMEDSLRSGLILTPIELLGIQTMYDTFFGILHNGGTWFVSCILFAYFIYPIIQELLKIMSIKSKASAMLLILFVLLYSSFLINEYSLSSTYSNPLYRSLEFAFGVILASILKENEDKIYVNKSNIIGLSILTLSTIALFLMVWFKPTIKNIPFYHYTYLPLLGLIFTGGYLVRNLYWEKNKALQYFSSLTYYFFLSQLFVWRLSSIVLEIMDLHRNRHKLLVSIAISVALSILVSEFLDKPIRRFSKPLLDKLSNGDKPVVHSSVSP